MTPSYNQAGFIRQTVESVRSQTHSDLDHFIIDGGSDDGTLDILEEYDELRVTSEPDRGQTHAVNKGFAQVDGDIVGWLNSDDLYVYRDTVATVVDAFKRTDADIVYGHAITIGPENEFLRAHYLPKFAPDKLERHCYLIQPAVFFRRHVVAENELNESREYSMDYEFWLDLAAGYDWFRLDELVAADRNHPARKIINAADASMKDTANLREERGIERNMRFKALQTADKIDLRWRRIRALPFMLDLYFSDPRTCAFPLRRRSLLRTLRTQLLGGKKTL